MLTVPAPWVSDCLEPLCALPQQISWRWTWSDATPSCAPVLGGAGFAVATGALFVLTLFCGPTGSKAFSRFDPDNDSVTSEMANRCCCWLSASSSCFCETEWRSKPSWRGKLHFSLQHLCLSALDSCN